MSKMKKLFTIILSAVLLLLGCAFPLFAQNSLSNTNSSASQPNQQVKLTTEEQAWLAAHPVIRLGIDAEWAPFVYPNEGKPEGLDIDLINRINELTGANMELITGRWDDLVKQAEKKEIDGLAQSAISEERQKFFHFSETYNSHYYALAISPTQGKTIRNSSDLRGKTVSIQKGNLWIRKLIESIEGVQIIEADSQSASFRLVMEGKTDASLITLSQYPTLRNAFKGNIAIAYVFHENKLDTVYSIRKDWPELVSIINKALSRISEREKNLLLEKWVGRETVELMKAPLNLTQEERAWVREHPVITFGVAEEFPPLNFINEDGEPAGYGIDYAILIARTLGIQYKFVSGSWSDVQQMAKAKEIDAIPLIFKNKDRDKYLEYTKPYTKMVHAIITKKQTQSIQSLKDLSDKRVGVMEGTYVHNYMQEDYPDTDIIAYSTYGEFLGALTNGEVDANVDTLPVINYWIKRIIQAQTSSSIRHTESF